MVIGLHPRCYSSRVTPDLVYASHALHWLPFHCPRGRFGATPTTHPHPTAHLRLYLFYLHYSFTPLVGPLICSHTPHVEHAHTHLPSTLGTHHCTARLPYLYTVHFTRYSIIAIVVPSHTLPHPPWLLPVVRGLPRLLHVWTYLPVLFAKLLHCPTCTFPRHLFHGLGPTVTQCRGPSYTPRTRSGRGFCAPPHLTIPHAAAAGLTRAPHHSWL